MRSVKSTEIDYLYKIFKPQLRPKKMLELGVFGGSSFENKIKEYPTSWFTKAELSKTFDAKQNYFKIKAGLPREHWIDKGWIFKEDPLGWFQWYCRFAKGRRIPTLMARKLKDGKILQDM